MGRQMIDFQYMLSRSREKQKAIASGATPEQLLRESRSLDHRNCGDGAGGFKIGNTCAKGSDGQQSAFPDIANCPPPCRLAQPLQDGQTLVVTDDSVEGAIRSFDWNAATAVKGTDDIVKYTDNPDLFNELYRYGEDTRFVPDDATASQITDRWRQDFPNGTKHGWHLATSEDDARFINDWGGVYSVIAHREPFLKKAIDEFNSKHPSEPPVQADGTKTYVNAVTTTTPANAIVIPHATKSDLFSINMQADPIRSAREDWDELSKQYKTEYKTTEDIKRALDERVTRSSAEGMNEYKVYSRFTAPNKQAIDLLNNSRDKRTVSAQEAARVEASVKAIAAKANPAGANFLTWRGLRVDDSIMSETDARRESERYAEEIRQSKPGDILKEAGMFSTSASPAVALGFASSNSVVFRVVGKSGAPIEKLTSMAGEHEVVYPDSASFQVVRVARNINLESSRFKRQNITVIDIVER